MTSLKSWTLLVLLLLSLIALDPVLAGGDKNEEFMDDDDNDNDNDDDDDDDDESEPTIRPSDFPTPEPTPLRGSASPAPTTALPSALPSASPTRLPTTAPPTLSFAPTTTMAPTHLPTKSPVEPTSPAPTLPPSDQPSRGPSNAPTLSVAPSVAPSDRPSGQSVQPLPTLLLSYTVLSSSTNDGDAGDEEATGGTTEAGDATRHLQQVDRVAMGWHVRNFVAQVLMTNANVNDAVQSSDLQDSVSYNPNTGSAIVSVSGSITLASRDLPTEIQLRDTLSTYLRQFGADDFTVWMRVAGWDIDGLVIDLDGRGVLVDQSGMNDGENNENDGGGRGTDGGGVVGSNNDSNANPNDVNRTLLIAGIAVGGVVVIVLAGLILRRKQEDTIVLPATTTAASTPTAGGNHNATATTTPPTDKPSNTNTSNSKPRRTMVDHTPMPQPLPRSILETTGHTAAPSHISNLSEDDTSGYPILRQQHNSPRSLDPTPESQSNHSDQISTSGLTTQDGDLQSYAGLVSLEDNAVFQSVPTLGSVGLAAAANKQAPPPAAVAAPPASLLGHSPYAARPDEDDDKSDDNVARARVAPTRLDMKYDASRLDQVIHSAKGASKELERQKQQQQNQKKQSSPHSVDSVSSGDDDLTGISYQA